MPQQSSRKRWSPTGVQFLVKHSSGTCYARGYRNGKQVWHSLGNSVVEAAQVLGAEKTTVHRLIYHKKPPGAPHRA